MLNLNMKSALKNENELVRDRKIIKNFKKLKKNRIFDRYLSITSVILIAFFRFEFSIKEIESLPHT